MAVRVSASPSLSPGRQHVFRTVPQSPALGFRSAAMQNAGFSANTVVTARHSKSTSDLGQAQMPHRVVGSANSGGAPPPARGVSPVPQPMSSPRETAGRVPVTSSVTGFAGIPARRSQAPNLKNGVEGMNVAVGTAPRHISPYRNQTAMQPSGSVVGSASLNSTGSAAVVIWPGLQRNDSAQPQQTPLSAAAHQAQLVNLEAASHSSPALSARARMAGGASWVFSRQVVAPLLAGSQNRTSSQSQKNESRGGLNSPRLAPVGQVLDKPTPDRRSPSPHSRHTTLQIARQSSTSGMRVPGFQQAPSGQKEIIRPELERQASGQLRNTVAMYPNSPTQGRSLQLPNYVSQSGAAVVSSSAFAANQGCAGSFPRRAASPVQHLLPQNPSQQQQLRQAHQLQYQQREQNPQGVAPGISVSDAAKLSQKRAMAAVRIQRFWRRRVAAINNSIAAAAKASATSYVVVPSPETSKVVMHESQAAATIRRPFVARHHAAARIQRAWKISRWRRRFEEVSVGEIGWLGRLDWLQHHNLLYGTELADPEDVYWWMTQRTDAPLDYEVDPWGCSKLRDHLNKMWYGRTSDEQAEADAAAAAAAAEAELAAQHEHERRRQQQLQAGSYSSHGAVHTTRREVAWSQQAGQALGTGRSVPNGLQAARLVPGGSLQYPIAVDKTVGLRSAGGSLGIASVGGAKATSLSPRRDAVRRSNGSATLAGASQPQLQRFQSPLQTHRTARTLQVATSGGSMVLPQGTASSGSSNTTPVTYKTQAQTLPSSVPAHHRLQSTLPASCRLQGSPRSQAWDRAAGSALGAAAQGPGLALAHRA